MARKRIKQKQKQAQRQSVVIHLAPKRQARHRRGQRPSERPREEQRPQMQIIPMPMYQQPQPQPFASLGTLERLEQRLDQVLANPVRTFEPTPVGTLATLEAVDQQRDQTVPIQPLVPANPFIKQEDAPATPRSSEPQESPVPIQKLFTPGLFAEAPLRKIRPPAGPPPESARRVGFIPENPILQSTVRTNANTYLGSLSHGRPRTTFNGTDSQYGRLASADFTRMTGRELKEYGERNGMTFAQSYTSKPQFERAINAAMRKHGGAPLGTPI